MSYPRNCWPNSARRSVIAPEPQLAFAHVLMGIVFVSLWGGSAGIWLGLVSLCWVVPWVRHAWQRYHYPPLTVFRWVGERVWQADTKNQDSLTVHFSPEHSFVSNHVLVLVFQSINTTSPRRYYLALTRAHQHPPTFDFFAQYARWF